MPNVMLTNLIEKISKAVRDLAEALAPRPTPVPVPVPIRPAGPSRARRY